MLTLSRRQFIQTAGAAGLSGLIPVSAYSMGNKPGQQTLRIISRSIEVNGKSKKVYGLVDEAGRHGLTFNKGDIFNVRLKNESNDPTLIHWHGVIPPWKADGVPGVTQDLLKPGKSYEYEFPLNISGTNWMHAHTLQEQDLLAAPFIIRDNQQVDEQEVVILLHDFSFKSPQELYTGLTGLDANGVMDHSKMDHSAMHHGAGGMDVNDIEYDAYLANDRTLDDPEVIQVEDGGRVRLRIINGAASTGFTIDVGELNGELIAVDGMDIIPVKGRQFPAAMAQRLDIRVTLPKGKNAFPILALREGSEHQTGVILAVTGAGIKKWSPLAESKGPILGIQFERQLRAANPLPEKEPDFKASFHLKGTMMPYEWSMERISPDKGQGLTVKQGQRVQISLYNASMMAHPIHLHGHHFQVVAVDDTPINGAVRDTVLIPPEVKVDIAFDANTPGKWAFHCHHLYHMATGMMGFVEYEGFKA